MSIARQIGDMIRTVRDKAKDADDMDERALWEEVQAELYEAHYLTMKIDARANRSEVVQQAINRHFGNHG